MGASLGLGAEKTRCSSLSLALPASPSSSAGPHSVPGMAGGRSQMQPGLMQPPFIPGQKTHNFHALETGSVI